MTKTWIEELHELNPDIIEDDSSTTKKEQKLDLFKVVLPALDRRNKKFYSNCDLEQQKELGKLIWLLTRWSSSTKNNSEHYLMMTNDIVNKNSSCLKQHPELQWQLLALCGIGKSQHHEWVAPPKGIKKNILEESVLKILPLLHDDELELFLKINTKDEIREFFRSYSYNDEEIKAII